MEDVGGVNMCIRHSSFTPPFEIFVHPDFEGKSIFYINRPNPKVY